MMKLDAFQGAVDHGFEFVEVLHFTPLGETLFRFFGAHPGGPAIGLIRLAHLLNFHQESFDHEFLHSARLPENSLGMQIEMKVARLNRAERSGFFRSFAFRGLAVRDDTAARVRAASRAS